MDKLRFRVSITELAHFCCRRGDLNPAREQRSPTATEGQAGHKRLQSLRTEDYQKEVTISAELESQHCQWKLAGRIDGLIETPRYCIEEIKTTYFTQPLLPPDQHHLHLAQARLYAALLLQQKKLDDIAITVTYLNLEDDSEYRFDYQETAHELQPFLDRCIQQYSDWLDRYFIYLQSRNQSLHHLQFPFQDYRPGQRQLSVTLYRDIRDKQNSLYHAPTGLGKTTAVLFPALKQLAEKTIRQIWYLTAKNSGQNSVRQTLEQLRAQRPNLRVLFLQAKTTICLCQSESGEMTRPSLHHASANNQATYQQPQAGCSFQSGYYDRLQSARVQFQNQLQFSERDLMELAQQFQLCPHQLSRDLLAWVDLVVADYNYVFDPQARLQEYLSKNTKSICLLIDESHNLPDRARAMFSVELAPHHLHQIALSVPSGSLKRKLKRLQTLLVQTIQTTQAEKHPDASLLRSLQTTAELTMDWYSGQNWLLEPAELFEHIIRLWQFAARSQTFEDSDVLIRLQNPASLRIFCADPASRIHQITEGFHSAHFFSGSLLPQNYFSRSFSLTGFSSTLILDSPFPPQNQLTLILPVNTRYQQRAQNVPQLANVVHTLWQERPGRYLVAFPSFEYLHLVQRELNPDLPILVQPKANQLQQRRAFFDALTQSEYLALVISGGVFAEGIDLQDNKLTGVIIVGTCLPPPSQEQDFIQQRFDQQNEPGFDFAYRYPGLNRVIQTAGRLIRDEQDRGVVMLLDDRYSQSQYRRHLPRQWNPSTITGTDQLARLLRDFFPI